MLCQSVFLSETSGNAGVTGGEPVVCPSISGLCRAGLLCLWLVDFRMEKPLNKESGAASVLKKQTVITVTACALQMLLCTLCELELMLRGYHGGSPTAVRPSDPALCGSCPYSPHIV